MPPDNYIPCNPSRSITSAFVLLNPQMVLIIYSDGYEMKLTFEEANRKVRVKGVPIIDFYAKLN